MKLVLQGLQECGTAGGGEGEELLYLLTVPAQGRDQFILRQPFVVQADAEKPRSEREDSISGRSQTLRTLNVCVLKIFILQSEFGLAPLEFCHGETERFSLERTRFYFCT